ncbi:MAG: hypothetical protein ACK4GW_00500 [Pseudorhodobacter sp.]
MRERITPDPLLGGGLEPEPGEPVLASFAPDRAAYWRSHGIMALVGGVLAGLLLVGMGNSAPWVGPVGAVLALLARGAYLASEVLALRWQLTDRRLILPGGRAVRLGEITAARPFLGDVQVVTRGGDKHLIRYPADPAAVVAEIDKARAAA